MTKILYVEDDPASQRLVERILSAEGFSISITDNGITAIEAARQEKPDLILMDINISGLDGYEVTTRLRSLPSLELVPIIAVTAATMAGDRERALVAGCSGYIPKPLDVDHFADQVRGYLLGDKDTLETDDHKEFYLEEYSQRLVSRLEAKVQELQVANNQLIKVEKMKSDFVILAGHELRTPLTVIYGYLQILKLNPDLPGDIGTPGSPFHLLSKVLAAVERLSEVIDDILNVSLIDADRLDLSHEPVILNSIIQSILHNMQNFGPQRKIIFELGSRIKDTPILEGDPSRLHQAISNIVSNAIKYTPDNGTIFIDAEQLDDVIHISIRDTGYGIPQTDLTNIFDRFYVLENTSLHKTSKTDLKGGGLGLGLTVAKGIIEAHQGKIWAESPGRDEITCPGSTFHILLPIGKPFSSWVK
ncbi:MAG: ATP-binding protein [Anaerolineae bacterium]|nr:ATP-binding protein [Anaerolineae bacterium]